jgi:hypothetical protein
MQTAASILGFLQGRSLQTWYSNMRFLSEPHQLPRDQLIAALALVWNLLGH